MTGWAVKQDDAGEKEGLPPVLSEYSRKLRALSLCCFLLIPGALVAQYNDEPGNVNQGPEAQFLELVDLVAEPEKQLELLDTFVKQFSTYAAISTVHAQRQELFIELKKWDQALEIGSKLLALDESDIETVRRNLQAAEGKGDTILVEKWKERLKQLEPPEGSVSVVSSVRLPFVDDVPEGDLAAVDLSSVPKQHRNRVEAFLFNRALEEKDLVRKLQLMSLFERQFPTSSHLSKIRYLFFRTHLERQDHPKALAAAEAVLERDRSREDVVFYTAQHYFVTKRSPEKVISLSTLMLELSTGKTRPDHITEEAWAKQNELLITQAHWMMGSIHLQQGRWADANKSLRLALASAPAGSELSELFLLNLGWSNYKLKNIEDSLKFYKQCIALRGPNQASASQSIASIKAEYNLE